MCRWPADTAFTPPAVSDGSFVVKHARMVQLLAAAAPEQVRGHLRARCGAAGLLGWEELGSGSQSSAILITD